MTTRILIAGVLTLGYMTTQALGVLCAGLVIALVPRNRPMKSAA